MAQGSNYEVQTQIAIVRKLAFAKPELLDEAQGLSVEVGRMLSSSIAALGSPGKKLEARS